MLPLVIRVDDTESRTSTVHAFDTSPVRVGRNDLNDLVLDSDAVSEFHAEIEFDESDTRVLDLGSTNGTAIAGTSLAPQVPQSAPPRTAVTLGPLVLVLDRAQPPPMLTAPHSRAPGSRDDAPARGTRVFSRSHTANAPAAAILPSPVAPASGAHAQATVIHVPPSDHARYAATVYGNQGGAAPTVEPMPAATVARAGEALAGIRPAYENYRRAWDALEAAIAQRLAQASPNDAAAMILAMDQQMEALAQEPHFRALALARGAWLMSRSATVAHAFERIGQVADHLGIARPVTPPEIDELLVSMVRALETFADAFVAVRESQQAVRRDLKRAQPARPAIDAAGMLTRLLDRTTPLEPRMDELRRAFADVMSHQSGLIQGVVRGVRGYMSRLSPEAVDSEVQRSGGAGFWGFIRAFRESALWQRYVARYRSSIGSDDEIRAAVFETRR